MCTRQCKPTPTQNTFSRHSFTSKYSSSRRTLVMANIRPLSPELAEKARLELNEVESRIPEDIATLRNWIEKQPHLNVRKSDQFLLAFLRGCKYSMEKAKQKIDYFFSFRTIYPEIFLDHQLSEKSLKLTRSGGLLRLPKPLHPGGPCILLTRYDGFDIDQFTYLDGFKNQMRTCMIQLEEDDHCIVAGIVNILDMSKATLGHLKAFDPVLFKKTGVFFDKAVPCRIKGIHLINLGPEAMTFLKVFSYLIPKKISGRMHIHSSMESLYEHVPKEYLPEEYGGNNGRICDIAEKSEKLMLKYKNYFEEEEQYKSNENLRVGAKINPESLFGLEGSFRKLEVD